MKTSESKNTFLTPRQKAREIAFQFFYRLDQQKEALVGKDAEGEFEKHAAHFNIPAESKDFAARLVTETMKSLKEVDAMIGKHAANWKFERIGAIEKSFLRIGTAELLYFKDVPASVTLNELIELSKNFGEEDTPSFINGILDPISREAQALAGKVASE
jgi:N utilization substance protein B